MQAQHYAASDNYAASPLASGQILDASEIREALTAALPRVRLHLRGRVPAGLDVDDLAQEASLRILSRLAHLRFRSPEEVGAYLRKVAWNLVLDEHRRTARRPAVAPLGDDVAGRLPSPLDHVLGLERRRRLTANLAQFRPEMRLAIISRLQGEADHRLAILLRRPSANAARVAVTRALAKVSERLRADSARPAARLQPASTTADV